jgi:uncharacterized damage-inducible protein DinB
MKIFNVSPYPGVHPELGVLLSTWADSTREWRENLESPTLDAITWQPYPGGPSIGGLLLHMASAEMYWLENAVNGTELDNNHPAIVYDNELDQYEVQWPTPPTESIDWYLDLLDTTRAKMINLVVAHNDPAREYPRRDYKVTYAWIIAHLVEHDSYTGGQAVLLHEMYKKVVLA